VTNRWWASLFVGVIALMAAMDAGVPLWRAVPFGDAMDFGLTSFFATWFILKALQERCA
jgi:hypothetical protein